MPIEVPAVPSLVTLGGAAVVVAVIVQLVKRVWQPTAAQADRFLPLVSVVAGIILTLVASVVLGTVDGASLLAAALTGLFAGWSASGLYDTVSGNTSSGGA